MNKSTAIKTAVFIVIAVFVSFFLHKSKKFFNENHNPYGTIESNLNIYKVKQKQDEELQAPSKPRIVEQAPVEFHESPTDVIIDEILAREEQPKPINVDKPINIPKPQKTEPKTEVLHIKSATKPKSNPKNDTKKEASPPKTLATKNIAKSVLNNPVFHSYIIQVGAFTSIKEAEAQQLKVSKLPFVEPYSFQINKVENYYKVTIGFFEDSTSARNICSELKKQNVQCFTTRL